MKERKEEGKQKDTKKEREKEKVFPVLTWPNVS